MKSCTFVTMPREASEPRSMSLFTAKDFSVSGVWRVVDYYMKMVIRTLSLDWKEEGVGKSI